jgi:hypothetical protein
MDQQCFLSSPRQTPGPGSEIDAIGYFSRMDYLQQPKQVPGVLIILEGLRGDNLID